MRNLPRPLAATLLSLAAATAQAFDAASLSPQIDPCSDFYGHVNNRWTAATELPSDRGRIGTFDELRKLNAERLAQLMVEASADPARQPTPGRRLV
ncbi:MAG: hypothetical protein WAQ05_21815, partial [Rubrivivax sp.]